MLNPDMDILGAINDFECMAGNPNFCKDKSEWLTFKKGDDTYRYSGRYRSWYDQGYAFAKEDPNASDGDTVSRCFVSDSDVSAIQLKSNEQELLATYLAHIQKICPDLFRHHEHRNLYTPYTVRKEYPCLDRKHAIFAELMRCRVQAIDHIDFEYDLPPSKNGVRPAPNKTTEDRQRFTMITCFRYFLMCRYVFEDPTSYPWIKRALTINFGGVPCIGHRYVENPHFEKKCIILIPVSAAGVTNVDYTTTHFCVSLLDVQWMDIGKDIENSLDDYDEGYLDDLEVIRAHRKLKAELNPLFPESRVAKHKEE